MDDPRLVAEAVLRHEECLAEMYATLADCFPDQTRIFSRLAVEEQVHRQYLRQLLQAVADGTLVLRPTSLRLHNIELSICSIVRLTNRAGLRQASLHEALSLARDLENTMIEERYFQLFEIRRSQFHALAQRLAEDTLRHRDALNNELKSRLATPT